MNGWRSWAPGTRVRHIVSGWVGDVVDVMAEGAGCDKVKVQWDRNGHTGWVTPAALSEERDRVKLRDDDIEGMTGRCPDCGQDVELVPLKLAPGSPPPRDPGPRFALHYLPADGRISGPVCCGYITARPPS